MRSSAAGQRRSAAMLRVARTTPAGIRIIAYNSCRNRHCPKCQASAARDWLEAREAELLPVPYFHVVFTLPAADRRHRLSEQARHLRSAVQGIRRDDADDCRRSQASRRQDRHHVGAAHLGLGDDASSARAHDRAGRRPVARWRAMGSLPQGASSCPCGCCRSCSDGLMLEKLAAAHASGKLNFFGGHAHLADATAFQRFLRPSGGASGSSTPSARSPGPRRCSPTCRATPTASPSRTGASSRPMRPASPSASRTTAPTAPTSARTR